MTHALLDSARLPALNRRVGQLADALLATMADGGFGALHATLGHVWNFGEIGDVDLKGLALCLAGGTTNETVALAASAVVEAFNALVVAADVPGTRTTPNGLAIHGALGRTKLEPAYKDLRLPEGLDRWPVPLSAYYGYAQ